MAGMMPEAEEEKTEATTADNSSEEAKEAQSLVSDEGEEPNVSEEEQRSYEDFVLAGMALIYKGGRVRPEVLQMLDKDPSDLRAVLTESEELQQFSPMLAVAATAVIIVLQLMRVAGEEKPSDAVIFHGGRALVEELAAIWSAHNKKQMSQSDVNHAFAQAADLYREAGTEQGYVNEEELKQVWGQVVAADKEGRLGEVAPAIDKINKLAAADADAAPVSGMGA